VSFQRLAAAVLAFLLLASTASLTTVHRWDQAATIRLQHAAPAADFPAAALVLLGNAEVLIPAAALTGVILLPRDRGRGTTALWLALGLIAVSLLAVGFKHVIPHPGPPAAFERHLPYRPGINIATAGSFPSGHTARATFLAGTALRRAPLLAGGLVLAMMAALVYLGDHWTSDVAGGLCLGWACVEAARGASWRFSRRSRTG